MNWAEGAVRPHVCFHLADILSMQLENEVELSISAEMERSLLVEAVERCGLLAICAPAGKTSQRARLLITDDESAVRGEVSPEYHAPLILLVRNEEPHDQHHYPWVLTRPLRVETVKREIEKAACANRTFAQREVLLIEELERARIVLESMSNGVTISDAALPDHPLVYVNPAFERMTGYTSSECCGRNSRFLQGEDRQQPDLPKIREALAQSEPIRALLKNYRKDGTPFWNELYMSPILDRKEKLTHFVGFQNDVTERVESALLLEHLASHDALTGLANRARLLQRMRQALPRARRMASAIAVLFFDLNNFKYVNDKFGHEAGDNLLKAVAERLISGTRAGEMVARLGGDEFIALLEDIVGEREAEIALERLTASLQAPYDLCGEEFYPSASTGLAIFPQDGESAEALLKAADCAMYLAKQAFHQADQYLAVSSIDCL